MSENTAGEESQRAGVSETISPSAAPVANSVAGGGGAAQTAAILAVILVLVAALDLFFFTGFYGSDDIEYLTAARAVYENGEFNAKADFGAERLTLLSWNVLAGMTCDFDFQIIAATYVLVHLLLCAACFLLAKLWFGRPTGLLAAYGVGMLPVAMIYSTCVSPDMMLATFFVLALFAFSCGVRARAADRPRRALLWLALAGLLVGFGYLTKSPALILLPFFFVYWLAIELWKRKRGMVLRGVAFAGCFFLVIAAESVTLNVLHDKPTFRLDWATKDASASTRAKVASYGKTPWERLEWVDKRYSSQYIPPGFKWALLAAVVLYPLVCRRGFSVWWLALWTFAYLTWGTMRLTEYLPPSIQTRYYTPVAALGVIILAAVAMRLREWLVRAGGFVYLGTALRVVTLIVFVGYPLLGLTGPDFMAGRLYYAWCVGGASRAIEHAWQADDAPIAVSPVVSARVVNPMLPPAARERIETYPCLEKTKAITALFEHGEFHYAMVENRYLRTEANGPLDRALRTLVMLNGDVIEASGELLTFDARLPVDSLCSPSVRCNDYRLLGGTITRFHTPLSRLATVAESVLGFGLAHSLVADRRTKAVTLVDVRTSPVPESPDDRAEAWVAELEPQAWQVWRAPGHTLSAREEDAGLRVEWEEAEEGYLWLLPTKGVAADSVTIAPHRRAELVVDVEMDSHVSAELIVKGAAAGMADARSTQIVTELWPGINRLHIPSSLAEREIRPVFRVLGYGWFELRGLSLRGMACEDVQDLLADGDAAPQGEGSQFVDSVELAVGRTYELTVVAELKSPAKLALRVIDESTLPARAVFEKELQLANGVNSICLANGPQTRHLKLELQEQVPGDVTLHECHLSAIPAP